MKNVTAILFFAVAALTATSCNDNNISTDKVSSTVQAGTWRITYFYDSDHEETSTFTGFSFTFQTNGTITAIKDVTTVTGSWNTGNDDSHVKLVLDFGSTFAFEELNEDWHVTERTDTKIKTEHISGGNGGIDYLTFEKI